MIDALAVKDIETPFYAYDISLLEKTLKELNEAIANQPYFVHYAIKANSNPELLKYIKQAGLGVDCVSGNEVQFAIDNGFSPDKIVFAGVGKTDKEIKTGLQHNIFSFNCESIQEIKIINELAEQMGKVANIAVRVNPNVDAETHKNITTGLEENKFGIQTWELDDLIECLTSAKHINLRGLHVHIGSQIVNMDIFAELAQRVNSIQEWFKEKDIEFEYVNVGGGLGVDYNEPEKNPIPDFKHYFNAFSKYLELKPNQAVHFELGRSIIAQCGQLITRVNYLKEGKATNFAIVDAGMTDLMRPALYQAKHKIVNLSNTNGETKLYNVVGPICESTDTFGKDIELPVTKRGDILAIQTAGAYGQVLSSRYNLRDLAKAYYFNKN